MLLVLLCPGDICCKWVASATLIFHCSGCMWVRFCGLTVCASCKFIQIFQGEDHLALHSVLLLLLLLCSEILTEHRLLHRNNTLLLCGIFFNVAHKCFQWIFILGRSEATSVDGLLLSLPLGREITLSGSILRSRIVHKERRHGRFRGFGCCNFT